MNPIVSNILLILLFIIIGGVFAAAEMALVSLRESQVKQLSTRGQRGRIVASLAANPNRFLSAVQIGITLVGIVTGLVSGAAIGGHISTWLKQFDLLLGGIGTAQSLLAETGDSTHPAQTETLIRLNAALEPSRDCFVAY